MNTSFLQQSDWLASLCRRLPDQARQALLQELDSPAAEQIDGPPAARLIEFYIRGAHELSAAGDETVDKYAISDFLQQMRSSLTEPNSAGAAPSSQMLVDLKAPSLRDAIKLVYKVSVSRDAVDEEVDIWLRNLGNGLAFHDFLLLMYHSDEAASRRKSDNICPDMDDGDFVLQMFRIVKRRGCNGYELDAVRRRLTDAGITRNQVLSNFFEEALEEDLAGADHMVHDGLSCSIMGTTEFLKVDDWRKAAKDKKAREQAKAALRPTTPFTIGSGSGLRVSAITSLYRGGEFIEQFMDNMTSQTVFSSHCELIIIDAASPENEAATIERYLGSHPNIRYKRMNYCVGIYEAWNIGVQMAEGRYLTNTNLDDLRREDSFEIQAGALDSLPFADVVYQDFYYTFDPFLSWEDVASFGYKSALPLITPHNMLRFNSPHNGPMWRRDLHHEIGLFDSSMKSAGDYDFWLRCLKAGKTFYKINEPHIVYYQNPKGLSTRADTRGIIEAKAVGRKYVSSLTPKALRCDFDSFRETLGEPRATDSRQDRHVATQTALRELSKRFKAGEMT